MNIQLTRVPEYFYLLAPSGEYEMCIKIFRRYSFYHSIRIENHSSSSQCCFDYEAQGTLSCYNTQIKTFSSSSERSKSVSTVYSLVQFPKGFS